MYSERIRLRRALWWGRDTPRSPREDLRRLAMLLTRIPAGAPASRWRRGEHWERRLFNKLNARAFACAQGCRVPDLYWEGRWLTRSALASLPDRFVIKPAIDAVRRNAYVMAGGQELLRGEPLSRARLFDRLRAARGLVSHVPLLAEELVPDEAGERVLAVDYKVHTFAGVIGAIQVIHRSPGPAMPAVNRFYSADWEPFDDPMFAGLPQAPPGEPPACLAGILADARTLGAAVGSYVRVDLYATSYGSVFGEFSSTPHGGDGFTPFANAYFESLWRRHCPDRI
ncbi:MAG: ATP-grasp fold amidoligase family protein [Deltaproteobacteria bacterium]|nr:ATP-grasp fold amidoligase family protein [Deltaproteobacteria bacterium]